MYVYISRSFYSSSSHIGFIRPLVLVVPSPISSPILSRVIPPIPGSPWPLYHSVLFHWKIPAPPPSQSHTRYNCGSKDWVCSSKASVDQERWRQQWKNRLLSRPDSFPLHCAVFTWHLVFPDISRAPPSAFLYSLSQRQGEKQRGKVSETILAIDIFLLLLLGRILPSLSR